MGGCEKRTCACEAEDYALLEIAARKRLIETQQSEIRLTGCSGDL
jgi:hypothetical protein